MISEQALNLFVLIQICIFPIQLFAWIGLRQENERKERMLRTTLKALGIIAVTRGKRQ